VTVIRPAAVLPARAESSGLSRAIGAFLALTVAADAAFLIGLTFTNGAESPLVNVGLSLATQWIPVTVFWLVAARTAFRHRTVIVAAAGVTFSAIGDGYWSVAADADGTLPQPWIADTGYLLFYPLMLIALVLLVRPQLRGVGGLVLLETAVATVGAAAVLAVILDPVLAAALTGDDMVTDAVAIAYPLFDLILIAMIAGIASVPGISFGPHRWALIAGLGVFAAADVAYALLANDDTYVVGTPLDATWAIGLGLITWWVTGVSGLPVERSVVSRRSVVSLPAVAVLAGLAVLVVGTQAELSMMAVVLAALTVALGAVPIIFRQAMLGRMLTAQEEAVRRLTELDRAKTDMLTTVNHEFRTPLTSINGHVDLLLDDDGLPPATRAVLETIERNGARLQALIDETFAASRFEDGTAALNRSVVDVADLSTRAVRGVEAAAAKHRVAVHLAAVDPELRIDGDPGHLGRALGNLLDNAVKFTEPGGRVLVSAERGKGGAVIRITDDGMGIPAGDIPRLFSRFFRASNVQNAAIPGVGLGLSTAKQIVEAHGGSIQVESAEGSGTTMTMRLPASADAAR
jgi:signal transduction histidine kinase